MSSCSRFTFVTCRRFASLVAGAGILVSGLSSADSPPQESPSGLELKAPAKLVPSDSPRVSPPSVSEPAGLQRVEPSEVELVPPGNSTLEIRVARRPWLLEKLSNAKPTPSEKTNPPQPPAELRDPPSISRIVPGSGEPGFEQSSPFAKLPEFSRRPSYLDRDRSGGGPSESNVESHHTGLQFREPQPLRDPVPPTQKPSPHEPLADASAQSQGRVMGGPVEPPSLGSGGNPSGGDQSGDQEADRQVQRSQPPAKFESIQDSAQAPEWDAISVRDLNIAPDGSPVHGSPVHGSPVQGSPASGESTPADSEPKESPQAIADVDASATHSDPNDLESSRVKWNESASVRSTNPSPRSKRDAADESNEGDDLDAQYVGDIEREETDDDVSPDDELATDEDSEFEHDDLAGDTAADDTAADDDEVAGSRNSDLDYTGHPKQPIQLTRNVARMNRMMQQCLRYYFNRPEVAAGRSNWGMMHSIMVYGIDTQVIVGRKKYSAIAWIAGNNACRGQKLLTEKDGKLFAKSGVGLQGHQAQFLAVLSLAGVPESYKLYADNTPYTVKDLVESERLACKRGEELTFTLIGLAHYTDTDSEWTSADGESWDFEKLIREELAQPIVGAACGGTHRLMGFGHALRARRAEGRPITGQWKRAEEYVENFVNYTYRLQNRDGSMSTDWFEGREDNGDLDRKIQTTGHMVEWLLTVTPDSELQNPRLVSAIQFLLSSMYNERSNDWAIGPKGHALRSLAMYYERVYQSGPAWRNPNVAQRRATNRR